jgi:cell division protein ZipA
MDSDLLRLILLGLGVALVVGIYLWDRYKRITRHYPRIKMGRNLEEPALNLPEVDDDVGEVRVRSHGRSRTAEPVMEMPDRVPDPVTAEGRKPEPEPERQASQSAAASDAGDLDGLGLRLDKAPSAGELDTEPFLLEPKGRAGDAFESQFTLDLEFNAHGDADYLNIDPALLSEVPRMIVQINVMSKGTPFSARQVHYAAAQVDLHHGEMSIFHRETDAGQVLFSMASVVEPGTFPPVDDAEFSTPGLILFTQLPGARDGLAIYADMLFTAERLSALLDAVLQDETRSKLTKQSIEHTREGILEHRRKIQLLRSRH